MKKTILGVIAIAIVLVGVFATSVNAATFETDKENVKIGDIVTLTLTTSQPVDSMQFEIAYESDKFEYLGDNNIGTAFGVVKSNPQANGYLMVSAYDGTTTTLSLKFKALKNAEGARFAIENTEFGKDDVALDDKLVSETIFIKVADPVTPDDDNKGDNDQGNNNQGENQGNNEGNNNENQEQDKQESENTNTEEYTNDEGEKIKKLPQTGSIMPVVTFGTIVLGIAFVGGYKMIKNK